MIKACTDHTKFSFMPRVLLMHVIRMQSQRALLHARSISCKLVQALPFPQQLHAAAIMAAFAGCCCYAFLDDGK